MTAIFVFNSLKLFAMYTQQTATKGFDKAATNFNTSSMQTSLSASGAKSRVLGHPSQPLTGTITSKENTSLLFRNALAFLSKNVKLSASDVTYSLSALDPL
jgi:hypothetical protein